MENPYQYSSLFTAGLLMTPRVVNSTVLQVSPPSPPPSSSLVATTRRLLSTKKPMPNLLTPLVIPTANASASRRATPGHGRRRSSITIQLSPLNSLKSPSKAAEEAWERTKRSAGLRHPTEAVQAVKEETMAKEERPSKENVSALNMDWVATSGALSMDRIATAGTVVPVSAVGRKRTRRSVNLRPKPAPNAPLPALPTLRPPFSPIQAQAPRPYLRIDTTEKKKGFF